jgi:hypothetical protein
MTILDPKKMTPQLIEACNDYEAKTRLTILYDEELEKDQAEMRAAFWALEAKRTKPHTCQRTTYICEECKGTITKGQQYTHHTITTGYGYPEGTHYQSRCKHHPTCPHKENPNHEPKHNTKR